MKKSGQFSLSPSSKTRFLSMLHMVQSTLFCERQCKGGSLSHYLSRCNWSQQPFLLHKNSCPKWEMVMRSRREKYTFFDTASCYKELFHISFFIYVSIYTHIYKYFWYGCRDRYSHRYTEEKRLIEISLRMLLLFSHSVMSDSFVTHMDCSPSGSSVHGILQARGLEWVAIPSSRGSSQLRDQAHVS